MRLARPRWHLAVSLGLAIIQYRRTGRLLPTAAPLISGFLIDLDHLLDYALYRLTPPDHAKQVERTIAVLPLHGWEWMMLTSVLEPLALRDRFSTAHGLTLGYLLHLLIDQFGNGFSTPLAYSVLHRASRRFRGPFFKRSADRQWRRESPRNLWKQF
jgi:hypothetical protein